MKAMEFRGNKSIVGPRIKEARKLQKISQVELAARMQTMEVNMDQKVISKIERNRRIVTDYEVACFAKALKVEKDWLLPSIKDKE